MITRELGCRHDGGANLMNEVCDSVTVLNGKGSGSSTTESPTGATSTESDLPDIKLVNPRLPESSDDPAVSNITPNNDSSLHNLLHNLLHWDLGRVRDRR